MFGEGDDPRRHPERMEVIARRYCGHTRTGISRIAILIYWIGGFFFLPWLWVVNYLYFKDWLRMRHTPDSVRWYARASLVGSFFYFALAIGWFTIYILKRAEWGAKADAISLLIPKGY